MVRVTVGAPGTHVVGVAVRPTTSGDESRGRSAKTILAVTDAAGHLLPASALRAGSAATEAFGYDVEIVPLVDPYALAVGDALPVEARVDGRPIAGATLEAGGTIGTSATPIPGQTLTTDGAGRATIRLTHDGGWFVSFVHARAGRKGEGAGTVVRCTTLTFGLLPAGAR